MEIKVKIKLKGKKEIEEIAKANSGADWMVLPPNIVEKIKPKKIASKVKAIGIGGKLIESPLYEVKIEVEDPKSKLKRSCKAKAIVAEIGTVLLSHEGNE